MKHIFVALLSESLQIKTNVPSIALCMMYKNGFKILNIKFYRSYLFFRFVKMFHNIIHSFSNAFLDLSSTGFWKNNEQWLNSHAREIN